MLNQMLNARFVVFQLIHHYSTFETYSYIYIHVHKHMSDVCYLVNTRQE